MTAFKRALEKCSTKGRSVKQHSANSLLSYQTAPQSASSKVPRELALKREFHTSVSLAARTSSACWLKDELNGHEKAKTYFSSEGPVSVS